MKSRFALILAALALATTPLAHAAALPARADQAHGEPSDETEAHTLKVAELKLAALAQEAKEADAASAAKDAPAAPAKKKPVHAVKNRHFKARIKASAVGKGGRKILGRRLTESEVKAILSTTRDFSGSDLSGLNLVGADLSGVKFNRANLHLANLERADLAESDLELADLTGANLRGASLNQARLRGTRMEGTRMDGALWIDKTICKSGSVGGCVE